MKFFGAHVSASGGVSAAVRNAVELGPLATTFAFFIRPRLTWKPAVDLSDQEVACFHSILQESSATNCFAVRHLSVHGSYLINLASHQPQLRAKSLELMLEEVLRCEKLGIGLYVFHPGSCTSKAALKRQRSVEQVTDELQCDRAAQRHQRLELVAWGIVEVLKRTTSPTIVVENMAGQGNVLCSTFEELRELLDCVTVQLVEQKLQVEAYQRRVGICLDTCHLFASGNFAMATRQDCDEMMARFDQLMGTAWPNVLKIVHVNDSKADQGSRRDRHANIGQGKVPIQVFQWLVTSQRFDGLPMILETPRDTNRKKTATATTTKKKSQLQKPKKSAETSSSVVPSAREEIELLVSMAEQDQHTV